MAISLPGDSTHYSATTTNAFQKKKHGLVTRYVPTRKSILTLIDLRTFPQMQTNFRFDLNSTVKDLENAISKFFDFPSSKHLRLFINGKELTIPSLPVADYIKTNHHQQLVLQRSSSTKTTISSNAIKVYYTCKARICSNSSSSSYNISPYGTSVFPKSLLKVLHLASLGFEAGYVPSLALDGCGGTYFLPSPCSNRSFVGVFKPQLQEPFCPNNPRGMTGRMHSPGLRTGIVSGESCYREVVAFDIDTRIRAGVPPARLCEVSHHQYFKKPLLLGSFQAYVPHDGVSSDYSPSLFDTLQVQAIALLDMKILNLDRNDANILVKKKSSSLNLIPIDHGYCLPDTIEVAWCDWCWWDWPQLKQKVSAELVERILKENDENHYLDLSLIRPECVWNMKIATLVIRVGLTTMSDITLFDISRVIAREEVDTPSVLEKCIAKTNARMLLNSTDDDITTDDDMIEITSPKKLLEKVLPNSPTTSGFWNDSPYSVVDTHEKKNDTINTTSDTSNDSSTPMKFFSREAEYFKILQEILFQVFKETGRRK